jgi:hypothetical protein
VDITWHAIWAARETSGTDIANDVDAGQALTIFGTNGTRSNPDGEGYGASGQYPAYTGATTGQLANVNGATKFIAVQVVRMPATSPPTTGEVLWEIGQRESPLTNMRVGVWIAGNGTSPRFRVNNADAVNSDITFSANTRYVIVTVWDSENATAAARALMRVNNTPTGTTQSITQNTAISYSAGSTDEMKAGVPFGRVAGLLQYLALGTFTGDVDGAVLDAIYANLAADNDLTGPPEGEGGGGDVEEGAGSTAISLTATGAGASIAAAAGAVSIAITASGAGASTAASAGAVAAALAASGVGTGIHVAAGSAALTLACSGAGTSLAAGAGATSCALSVVGAGASTAGAAGAVSAALAASGAGAAIGSGVGATSFACTVSGAGASVAASAGSASIALTVAAEGASLSDGSSVGSVSIAVSCLGAGASTAASAGSPSASLAVDARGQAVTQAAGSASAAITIAGAGTSIAAGAGVVSIAVSVEAEGASAGSAASVTIAVTVSAVGASVAEAAGAVSIDLGVAGASEVIVPPDPPGATTWTKGDAPSVTPGGWTVGDRPSVASWTRGQQPNQSLPIAA